MTGFQSTCYMMPNKHSQCVHTSCLSIKLSANNLLFFQCPCFYVFSKNSLPLLDTFIKEKKVDLSSPTCDVNSDPIVCFYLIFPTFHFLRRLRLKRKTLQETLCLGSFQGNFCWTLKRLRARFHSENNIVILLCDRQMVIFHTCKVMKILS